MTCEECTDRLSDALDGDLDATEAAAVDAHLRECAACRAVADGLAQVAAGARALPRHEVPAGVWPRVAAALEHPGAGAWLPAWLIPSRPAAWRHAAAAALIVLAAGLGWVLWSGSVPGLGPAPAPPAAASAEEAVQTVETELGLAQEHYERAIASLEAITTAEGSTLDPELAAVLQRNLEVIDGAINESRQALTAQPTSDVVQQSLFDALRSKVTLLQDIVTLINEMRQGDQEGAARVLSGLNP